MGQPILLFRIDIGLDPARGYAAVVHDIGLARMKGIKGNSIRNLMRSLTQEVCEEEQRKRRFPLESEQSKSSIITPNGF